MERTRVLIADDDALVRDALRVLLGVDDRFEVVASVENGEQAVRVCEKRPVDVALLDVRMPVLDGLGASQRISARGVRVLILTTFDDDEVVVGAIRSGARGYLLKSTPPDRIKEAILTVAAGTSVLQDTALEALRGGLDRPGGAMSLEGLSPREVAVVQAVAEGLSNRAIADRLFISEGTVKNHVSAILDKTGLEHRTQLAVYYLTGRRPTGPG